MANDRADAGSESRIGVCVSLPLAWVNCIRSVLDDTHQALAMESYVMAVAGVAIVMLSTNAVAPSPSRRRSVVPVADNKASREAAKASTAPSASRVAGPVTWLASHNAVPVPSTMVLRALSKAT